MKIKHALLWLMVAILMSLTTSTRTQAQGVNITVDWHGTPVTVDSVDLDQWNKHGIVSGMASDMEIMGEEIDALKSGGFKDGKRTAAVLGIIASRRGKAKVEAGIRAEVLKLVDGDTSKVTSHPYYQFRMNELRKAGAEQAYADAFGAELVALLDKAPGAGGGQAIDIAKLTADITAAVRKELKPGLSEAQVDTKIKDAKDEIYGHTDNGFAKVASVISGRGADGKKLSGDEKDQVLRQLAEGKY